MAIAQHDSRRPRSSSLADVLEIILDKGLVIDAYVRVSLVGIELLTIDARIVVASVDTYLRFAREVNRLDLGGGESTQPRGLPETLGQMQQGGARSRTRGMLEGAGETVRERLGGHGHDDDDDDGGRARGGGIVQQAASSLRHALSGDEDEGEDDGERRRPRRQPQSQSRDQGDEGDEGSGDEAEGDDRARSGSQRRPPDERQVPGRTRSR